MSLVDELTVRANDLMASLDAKPKTTMEIVEFMRYFDEVGKHIDQLISEVDMAYQCFVLMKDFNIFVDEPEKESYMGNHIRQPASMTKFASKCRCINLQIVKI